MNVNDKLNLIREVGEEIITDEELKKLIESGTRLIAYDGFEPSGKIHIAQGLLRAVNINKMVDADVHFKMLVADWHAWANHKMDGDMKKIRTVGEYFIEVWKACGMRNDKIEFVWASDLVKKEGYWELVMKIAIENNLPRIIRTVQIMGREETDSLSASQILYPLMQAADIFMLEAAASNSKGTAETVLELHTHESEKDVADRDDVESTGGDNEEAAGDSGGESPADNIDPPDEDFMETINGAEGNDINEPPTISEIVFFDCANPHDGPLLSGSEYDVSVNASDPDGDSLSYSWAVSGGSIAEPDKSQTAIIAPNATGTYNISVIVDDGRGGLAEESLDFTVMAAITLTEAPGICGGYIIKDTDAYPSSSAMVGDYINNKPIRGFLSFDISGLAGIEIISASLVFNEYQEHNNPSDFIEAVWVISVNWGTGNIKPAHYDLQGTLIGEHSIPTFTCSNQKLVDELNQAIGDGRPSFQVMLRHKGYMSNNNNLPDTLKYGGSFPVKLNVYYTN